MGLSPSKLTEKLSLAWLETFLDLPYGIPDHDTFGRVFGMLEAQELQNSFLAWVSSNTIEIGTGTDSYRSA